jgi:xylulokinase
MECREMEAAIGAESIYRTTGMRCTTGVCGPSLIWVKRHEPTVYEQAEHALFPKDYIRYRLTGDISTDATDASGSLLFDITRREWANHMIKTLGVRSELLPTIRDSTSVVGCVTDAAAAVTGLAAGTPVAVGAADQAMGALGSGLLEPGTVSCAIGTGGQVITTVGEPIFDYRRGLQLMCHISSDAWLLMGATLAAGLSLRWFGEVFGAAGPSQNGDDEQPYEALSSEAALVAPGSDGLLFLPYLAGERTPHMDPHARGCFIGFDFSHKRGHFVRSIMEGVAFSLKDTLVAFEQLGIEMTSIVASGGGAKSALWRTIQADVYGRDLTITGHDEHSALGAALVAGVASEVFADLRQASHRVDRGWTTVTANPDNVQIYETRHAVYRLLYPALRLVAW